MAERQGSTENSESPRVRVAVSVVGHPAGEQRAERVHISQHGQRRGQAHIFGQQKLGAPDRFRQHRQRRAGPYLVRHGRRRVQHRAKQPGQQHHSQRAVLDQFGVVAEAEVRDRGQKNIEHGRARHQQQKNRLPDQFHERVARNGQKLSHFNG